MCRGVQHCSSSLLLGAARCAFWARPRGPHIIMQATTQLCNNSMSGAEAVLQHMTRPGRPGLRGPPVRATTTAWHRACTACRAMASMHVHSDPARVKGSVIQYYYNNNLPSFWYQSNKCVDMLPKSNAKVVAWRQDSEWTCGQSQNGQNDQILRFIYCILVQDKITIFQFASDRL